MVLCLTEIHGLGHPDIKGEGSVTLTKGQRIILFIAGLSNIAIMYNALGMYGWNRIGHGFLAFLCLTSAAVCFFLSFGARKGGEK